ncbi:MAG: DUF2079 domain-containing protein [Patescibacteria group bacterium]|nr:DUF2079 domain-containing protein [Patescibacteria group bacterium]MDD5490826.1 DUF2079 domain-containing protein [Patescibacteria group bacterium]
MQKILKWIIKNNFKLLGLLIIVYIVAFSFISFWKYDNFLYNGLDLAIFNNTFYNTVHGDWFGLSIHPPTYLGDHFEPIILLLAPLYYFWQSPLFLLVLQTIFLALGAWPVYKITQKIFVDEKYKKWLPLALAAIYLLNPVLHNINLYEVHLYPLALFFLLWAFYFYYSNRFWPYFVFILLALFVREDTALIVLMFGFLSLWERKSWRFVLTSFLLGAGWFIFSLQVINHFSPAGSYKFVAFYGWLGSSFPEMILNFFPHFGAVAAHLVRPGNWLMIFGLLAPFFYIPFLKPKYLLLALPPFLQIALAEAGGSDTILRTQYGLFFLLGIVVAFIFGLNKISSGNFYKKRADVFWVSLAAGILYLNLALGPLPEFFAKFGNEQIALDRINSREVIKEIPSEEPVAASWSLRSNLSLRKDLYALNYVFYGKQQFGFTPYRLPENTEYLILDSREIVSFYFNFFLHKHLWNIYESGDNRLREEILKNNLGAVKVIDNLVLFQKNTAEKVELYELPDSLPVENFKNNKIVSESGINFLGYQTSEIAASDLIPISLFWENSRESKDEYFISRRVVDEGGQIMERELLPFNYGLYPPNEWPANMIIKTNYWWNFSEEIKNRLLAGEYKLEINLVQIKGGNELDRMGSIKQVIDEEKVLASPVSLDIFNH